MAENNQNTEVEDILSSIKNILEEDEQKHGSLSASSGKTDDVVDDVINSAPEVNDILELSPDMRIDETPSAEAPLQGKADADPVASVILEPEDNHTIAEHIETVDNVQHGIAVYRVILHVAALHGVDGAAEVALVAQYVVELNHHRQRLAFEEAL